MIPHIIFDINPNYNVTQDIANLTNISTDIFWKAFQPFIGVLGYQPFWTIFFVVLGLGIAYMSRLNMTLLLAYFIMVDVLFAFAMMPLALLIFGIITSLIGTIIIYRSFVSKR